MNAIGVAADRETGADIECRIDMEPRLRRCQTDPDIAVFNRSNFGKFRDDIYEFFQAVFSGERARCGHTDVFGGIDTHALSPHRIRGANAKNGGGSVSLRICREYIVFRKFLQHK